MRIRLVVIVGLATLACVRPRNILEPVEGAFEATYPDSAHYVLEAAAYAVTDFAVPIIQYDKRRQYLETEYIDVANFPATVSREGYMGNERLVKFQFRTLPTFGATRLIGEVMYRPAGGESRAMERMVPPEHVGREMLTRLYARIQERLVRERAEREAKTKEEHE
jgi:hypothetical protein